MFLPDFCIKRPVTATMLVLSLVVFGLIGLSRLGISLNPDVDFPFITVRTIWQNARPGEVDNDVTDELEDAIAGVSGIKHINSQSMQGQSQIAIEFELGKDVDVAAQEVRDKVAARVYKLPQDAETPVIDKLDINAQPIMYIAFTGQQAIEEIRRAADEKIRPMIQKIQGVGEVRFGGGPEKEIKIWLQRERLAAYGIGVDEVIDAVRRQHVELPGGQIESSKKEFLIRTMGEFETPRAFNNLIVAYRDGTPIRLSQVGYAEAGREDNKPVPRWTTAQGVEKTIALAVAPRSGANDVAIAREIKDMLPEIQKVLTEEMKVHIATDSTIFIEQSISEIRFQLLLGAIMAAVVIFFFLQNMSTTLFSAIAIPSSIIATFSFIYALGFTLNNMTMLALVTAVGLVVDDSIVMVENIFRHRSALGKGAMAAAFEGSSEIGFAILTTTVALLGIFIPVAFMGGIIGRFFFEFSVTMAFAVACSTFVALTIVPMLSSRFLRLPREKGQGLRMFNRFMDLLSNTYRKMLSAFLRHRVLVVLVTFLIFLFGVWFFTLVGKEFGTSEDRSAFMIRLEGPLSYSTEKMDDVMKRFEVFLRSIPEFESMFTASGFPGTNNAIAYMNLVPKDQRTRSQKQVMSEIRSVLATYPDLRGSVSDVSMLGGGRRNDDIQLVIQGQDISTIDRYSRMIMDRLEKTPGYVGVTRDLEIGKPELRIRINREKAAEAGISVRSIASAVGALLGGVDVAEYKEDGKSFDIRLRLVRDQRILPNDLQRIWIRSTNGMLVDISNYVTIENGVGPNVINRVDRQRSATIFTNIEGKLLGDALPEVKKIADGILPAGYTSRFSGRSEAFGESIEYFVLAFILAIVFTYMVLAAQFESFTQPFAIMMGLPLSFIGAFGLLYLLGNTLNMSSMIGLVLLVGLATKNGILMIDYTNQLRKTGMEKNDALVEAGATRLRPILMTAISTIAGVAPVAIGMGVGNESRQPLAVVITGGLISTTFLTLAVVPVIYSYLDQLAHWRPLKRLQKRIMAGE